ERLRELRSVVDQRGAAGRVEQPIDVGEIGDMWPVQNCARELGGFDRILAAVGDEGFADENHAGEAIEQAEFADRIADIDGSVRTRLRALRAPRAVKAEALHIRGDI